MKKQPFLINAGIDWLTQSGIKPYMLVDCEELSKDLWVPKNKIVDGAIVLDVSRNAISEFSLDENFVSFVGKVDGIRFVFKIPVEKVVAIYDKDSGESIRVCGKHEASFYALHFAQTAATCAEGLIKGSTNS